MAHRVRVEEADTAHRRMGEADMDHPVLVAVDTDHLRTDEEAMVLVEATALPVE